MDRAVASSCLARTPRYTHQLLPFPNPTWDASKYAIDASLTDRGSMKLGVSLYGEAAYGRSFLDWTAANQPGEYGITEFHPLRAMDAAELRRTFQTHRDNGARFLSFFLEAKGENPEPEADAQGNRHSFDPANTLYGSDQLYRSTQELLSQP
jgi:hypothetical protein